MRTILRRCVATTRRRPTRRRSASAKSGVESMLAEAKDWHRLRRFRLRGLYTVNIEGLLVAAGQNLKRFLAATEWSRRHAPYGSLAALSWDPQRLSATLSRLWVMIDSARDSGTGEVEQ
jgi:hypothetical protein